MELTEQEKAQVARLREKGAGTMTPGTPLVAFESMSDEEVLRWAQHQRLRLELDVLSSLADMVEFMEGPR